MRKLVLLFALVITTVAAASAFNTPAEVPAAGTAAPAFKLVTNEGKEASLADFKGQWVVLYFYYNYCTLQARNIERDLAKYEQAKAVILGISVDPAEKLRRPCSNQVLTFKLLSDQDAKVSKQYGSFAEFHRYVLGKNALPEKAPGTEKQSTRNTFIIDPAGKIAKVFVNVKTAEHSDEVLAALAELQNANQKKAGE